MSALDRQRLLEKISSERILVLDGAMGTMLQRHKLEERTSAASGSPRTRAICKGDNDVLVLTRPDVVESIHEQYFEAGADIVETNTFSGTAVAQADYGLEGARVRDERRGGAPGPTRRRPVDRPNAGQAALRRRVHRSHEQDAVAFARRQRPGVPRHRLRRSCATPMPSRCAACSTAAATCLLIETIFDTLNAKAAIVAIEEVFERRGTRVPVMIVGHDHRSQRPHAVGADRRCVLGLGRPRTALQRGHQLRARRPARCVRTWPSWPRFATTRVSCYPNAGLPNAFGEYDEQAGGDGGAPRRIRARRASSTSSAAAAGPRPITSAPSRGRLREHLHDRSLHAHPAAARTQRPA